MLYALVGCLIIIGILGYKLYQKVEVDKEKLQIYQRQLDDLQQSIEYDKEEEKKLLHTLVDLRLESATKRNDMVQAEDRCRRARAEYDNIIKVKTEEINALMDEQRQKRQDELDRTFEEKKAHYDTLLNEALKECGKQTEKALEFTNNKLQEYTEANELFDKKIAECKARFESIEKTLRQYDAEQQEKLFYTIQLPEEFQEDIEFLLTTVAAKVQHPDIISKLVWTEYVKPNLDDTFKRIEIKPEPGIYKLTSLLNGKCYIGKSTDVKKRIADHFKSVVGIKSIADQAVHHAILKEGFWNWQIEIITYCDKEQLSELEKYYIEFFKTQEFGYNRNAGG